MTAAFTIAILGGTGQQGRGLAQRLARAGHRIIVASRDPQRARDAVSSWPDGDRSIDVNDYSGAVSEADVTIVAVPFGSATDILAGVRDRFRAGSVVIDITVPVTFVGGTMTMIDVTEGSAAEHVRAHVPAGVHVAGTFKTIPAHLLGAVDRPLDCDEFVCGDSDVARTHAADLVSALPGLRPVDVGPLARARSIEQLTALAIAINRRHKIHDARFRVVGLT
jgi:8-hydroxy-5-deazaflavin:NADPH oxidoreductase